MNANRTAFVVLDFYKDLRRRLRACGSREAVLKLMTDPFVRSCIMDMSDEMRLELRSHARERVRELAAYHGPESEPAAGEEDQRPPEERKP
jgi:hypothetical protein